MPDFGIMRGFNEKLFGDKLVAGQLPTQLGLIGSQSTFVGLLDTYPNAAAAYSVRLLKLDYSGNAIRVRRSSDNTEQDIGFTGLGDLNTSALTTFCSGTNGFVTTWYDQSGNGRNATQTTAASQPQIVSSGSILLLNGKPNIFFDGTNDRFSLTSTIANQSTYSAFIVAQTPNDLSLGDVIMGGADGSTGFKFDGAILTANMTITRTNQADILTATIPQNIQILATFLTTSTDSKIYANAVLKGTGATVNSTQPIGFIGSADAQFFKNAMQEIVLYTTNQLTNRTGIETNINTYYAIY